MQRQQQLTEWLHSLFPNETFSIAPASADASFRRYFRATFAEGRTLIVMDAPPQHENCQPFLHIGKLFEDAGTHVPHVHAQDLAQGFLLLSDLGNTTYLQALNADSARQLYGAATDALIKIQLASREDELPPYDEALLRRELNLFPEWYIAKHLGVVLSDKQQAALEESFRRILANNLAQPRVYVHRDYHSRNLMVAEPNPGILDFQDAVYGPITYDLASLFKDAYIKWEEEEIMDWLIRYWEKARKAGLPVRADFGEFYRDYEWMGVQRHIKVLGIFARLYHRDGKDGYLKDMPLVMDYLRRACERYIDLKPLLNLLDALEPRETQVGYTF
ncbi:aminoglycoside phosphotransferase [Ferrigenium kumadai]|uniref:Aminoglycoside phosphotransferase n=1 Tax=Ferrigenium kumadai TaxID=1682490 RepID=A0AAN1SX29_9PROT|nr:phosphotransferase [Ferrigenium kumadai]BBI98410.1 aminoglycoside phosphotransferase [Ferrigenium kumadai]